MDEASCDQENSQILSNDKADKEDPTARVMVFITVKMYISACLIYILIDFLIDFKICLSSRFLYFCDCAAVSPFALLREGGSVEPEGS